MYSGIKTVKSKSSGAIGIATTGVLAVDVVLRAENGDEVLVRAAELNNEVVISDWLGWTLRLTPAAGVTYSVTGAVDVT